jgi:hypothetical protein
VDAARQQQHAQQQYWVCSKDTLYLLTDLTPDSRIRQLGGGASANIGRSNVLCAEHRRFVEEDLLYRCNPLHPCISSSSCSRPRRSPHAASTSVVQRWISGWPLSGAPLSDVMFSWNRSLNLSISR